MSLLKKFTPKKVIKCSSCNTRIKFPVKPGKTLRVTCPKCRSSYDVSFVNPLVQLIKGQLNWSLLSKSDKRRLIIVLLTLVVALGLIITSFKKPIKPNLKSPEVILSNVN